MKAGDIFLKDLENKKRLEELIQARLRADMYFRYVVWKFELKDKVEGY